MDFEYFSSLKLGSTESEIKDIVFSDNWSLFRTHAPFSTHFAEWGSGLSTFYVANQERNRKVVTVETDPTWSQRVSDTVVPNSEKIEIKYVDFGPVRNWGRPESYSKIENVWKYSSAPFSNGYSPDLILIDGRFRVHCFLESLLKARNGTKIIFDDYTNRPWYQIVEDFAIPIETSGRQALFVVNIKISRRSKIRELSKQFSYVMD